MPPVKAPPVQAVAPKAAARARAAIAAFVWPAVRDGDLARAARERLMVLFALIAGIGGLIAVLVNLESFAEIPATIGVSVAGSVLLLLVPAYFHRSGNFERSARILIAVYVVPLAIANGLTGGLLTAESIFLLAAPIGAGLLLGLRPALVTGGGLVGIFLLFHLARDRLGMPLHGMEPDRWSASLAFVLILLTIGLSLGVGAFHKVIDVTNRQLKEARDTAEAANEAKSQFLANMSHELRTPLNGILGFADLLSDHELNGEARGHLRQIRRSSADLLALVNDVLEFSRAETGALRLERLPFDLHALVEDLRQRFLPRMDRQGLAFEVAIAPEVPRWVLGDALRLRQVLGNLLDNAVKFTEAGSIRLSVDRTGNPASGAIDAGGTGAGYLCFEVADTGVGIPPEALPTLFDRFTQADSSTTRRYGGSGLGLAIVRILVGLMDGGIEVRSQPGAGTHFRATISLPATDRPPADAEEALPADPPARAGAARRRARHPGAVLLVEDSPTNQLLFRTLLTRAGHRVHIAPNGQAALDALRLDRFDLVLMDGQMPVMGGMEAARAIRSSGEAFAAVPIVALTANVMARDESSYREVGMNDYLAKPVDLNRLLDKVDEWIGRRGT